MEEQNRMQKEPEIKTEEGFSYTYSAKEQEELKKIRQKYQPKEEDKMELLRKLDASVTKKATSVSITVGTLGALILGMGMSLTMTQIGDIFGMTRKMQMIVGIMIGVIGIVFVGMAFPIFNKILKKEREKAAPQILKLTEELMQ